MTARELIEKLQAFPPEWPVVLAGGRENPCTSAVCRRVGVTDRGDYTLDPGYWGPDEIKIFGAVVLDSDGPH